MVLVMPLGEICLGCWEWGIWLTLGAMGAPADPLVPKKADILAQRIAFLRRINGDTTAFQVREHLGQPERISRQLLFRQYREQWFWQWEAPPDRGKVPSGQVFQVRVEFHCSPNQEPRVRSVWTNFPLDGP